MYVLILLSCLGLRKRASMNRKDESAKEVFDQNLYQYIVSFKTITMGFVANGLEDGNFD